MKLVILSVLLLFSVSSVLAVDPFVSSASVSETREQIQSLPEDDIWWTAYGPDQGWNFKNLHRFMPTVNVYRAGPVKPLDSAPNAGIADFAVSLENGKQVSFAELLDSDSSTAMGVLVLHKGKVVFESYPRMQPYEKPVYWSVTKVFVSALVAIYEGRGLVDVSKPIDHYIPELEASSYSGVSVRNVLDMAPGISCAEEYVDKTSCYYRYSIAIGDGFWAKDSPDNPYDLIAALKVDRYAEQGTHWQYSGVNTFVLGWLVEKLAGMPFQDALSREIWTKMGAEADASILAPRFGVPITHGGLLATHRDVARFGLLHTESYKLLNSQRILPAQYIERLTNGGNPLLTKDLPIEKDPQDQVKFRTYQWDDIYANNDLYKGGWAGQGLLVNPDKDIVVVYTGYFKKDESEVYLLPIIRNMLNSVYPGPS
ncbi:MAG: serine hydrolase domain-containing protein [Pseudomonadales bacterium]